jgi:hypothetical protein
MLAQKDILNLELEDNRLQLNSEIVLLQAATEEQIKYTHSRYFGFSIEAAIHQFQSVITAHFVSAKGFCK